MAEPQTFMTTTQLQTLRARFGREAVETLTAQDPAWLKEKRLKAWEAFEGLSGIESASGSRWIDELKQAGQWAFEPGPALPLQASEAPTLSEGAWGTLSGASLYGPGAHGPWALSDAAKAAGVVYLPLREALRSHETLLKDRLFSSTAIDESAWAALNAAFLGDGHFLYIPKNVSLKEPFLSRGLHTASHAAFLPRTLVIVEDGAEATLVDEFASAGQAPGFCAAVSELYIGKNARLNYISHQDLNRASGFVSRQNTKLERDASLYTLGIVSGGAWSSSFIGTRLEGEGARADLLGLVLAAAGQKVEIRTLQDHLGLAGESDALIKSILRDQSRFYFDGVVRIFKSGQKSNAFQSNPNLLLSSDARAESIPTLEIEADDVACKHAASIGSIDENERFYLLSRGISPKDAEAVIVEGFAVELAGRLPNEQLQERFGALLEGLAKRA